MSDEIKNSIKALIPQIQQLLANNGLGEIVIELDSWGGGCEFQESVNFRDQDNRAIGRWANNRDPLMIANAEALEADNVIQEVKEKLSELADENYDEWLDEDNGGTVVLRVGLNADDTQITYSYREEESHNGHYEEDTEILLSSEDGFQVEGGFKTWQQIFAYFRKEQRSNPDATLNFNIQFWGGGDSGSIEDVESGCDTILGKRVQMEDGTSKPVQGVIEDFAYHFIESSGVDWYNNEGGGGSMQLLLTEEPEPKAIFTLEVNYNELELRESCTEKI